MSMAQAVSLPRILVSTDASKALSKQAASTRKPRTSISTKKRGNLTFLFGIGKNKLKKKKKKLFRPAKVKFFLAKTDYYNPFGNLVRVD